MDLDELRSVQSKERRKDSLQHLRDSFYEDVAAYLTERKRQRDERAASVDQPFSDEQVRKLSDEIETAEEVVESLYERRVGKVVKLSSFAAAGAPTDTEGMTIQEAELFEDLVVRIEQNKDRVLNVLETGADVDVGVETPQQEAATAAPATGSGGGEAPSPVADATTEAESASSAPSAPGTGADSGGGGVLADAMGGGESDGDGPGADASAGSADTAPPTPPETPDVAVDASTSADAADAVDAPDEFVPGSEPDRAGTASQEEPTPDAVGDASSTPSTPETATESTSEQAPEAADASAAEADSPSRRTVRITQDVGSILGVDDVEYDLASEDVVSLPADNVAPLLERDAAEPID
ncbi:hypothetical protein [Halobaculum limi]|uniref:hypothetical protein n=1 Tax=Halobaculum limi TaxID=3031916 RepID=UPI00240519E0|nr:hypothetical protein [Halobaculum sp. YSMS11]